MYKVDAYKGLCIIVFASSLDKDLLSACSVHIHIIIYEKQLNNGFLVCTCHL
jgi:hypothetical protein